jgi:hypothetical protein
LKGVAASREVMVGILAGIKCMYCSGWKFGSVWRVLTRSHADSDMLLQLLGFACPPNVIQRERRKVSGVSRQLLAAASGAERCPRLKARFQSVLARNILVDG